MERQFSFSALNCQLKRDLCHQHSVPPAGGRKETRIWGGHRTRRLLRAIAQPQTSTTEDIHFWLMTNTNKLCGTEETSCRSSLAIASKTSCIIHYYTKWNIFLALFVCSSAGDLKQHAICKIPCDKDGGRVCVFEGGVCVMLLLQRKDQNETQTFRWTRSSWTFWANGLELG